MIPKIIHYCWFGKGLMPKSQKDCIKGWKKLMPDYQIMRWDESNFDYNQYKASKYAHKVKKYALVSDVCRYNVLAEYGGIYLDTDVEVFQRFDRFLDCKFFSAVELYKAEFEREGKEQVDSEGNPLVPGTEIPNFEMLTSTLACVPQQEMILALRDFYNAIDADEEYARNYRNYVDNDRLVAKYAAQRGFRYLDQTQYFGDDMVVYGTGIFGYKSSPTNQFEVSFHHNAATWRSGDEISKAERRRVFFDKLGLLRVYEVIRSVYKSRLSSSKNKLVFHLGHSAGFYSEFNNMVLAMLYCQMHNIEFELYSKDANFGSKKGWDDFFLPFCKERISCVHHYVNQRYENPKGKRGVLCQWYRNICRHTLLTQDLWSEFHNMVVTDEMKKALGDIVADIYRFNDVTKKEINALQSHISLPESYLGFHIRCGDKSIEHCMVDLDEYIHKAESYSDNRVGFIYTDDYSIVEMALRKYNNWQFFTLTPKESRGYYHSDFEKQNSLDKRRSLITMFASMEILKNAEYTFCTYSSNIGIFLGMVIGARAVGVDYDNWMVW